MYKNVHLYNNRLNSISSRFIITAKTLQPNPHNKRNSKSNILCSNVFYVVYNFEQ